MKGTERNFTMNSTSIKPKKRIALQTIDRVASDFIKAEKKIKDEHTKKIAFEKYAEERRLKEGLN